MIGASKKQSKKELTPKKRYFKPNPRRQALYVLVTLVGIFGGYYVGGFFKTSKDPAQSAQPWHLTQSPPPAMISAPDSPLFPDSMDEHSKAPRRAYEEALPQDIYEPPVVRLPMPPPPKPAPIETAPIETAPLEPLEPASIPAQELEAKPAPKEKRVLPSAWRRFAVAAPQSGDRPRIALVIDDMGVDQKRSAKIIGLKAPLTLSFLTYAENLKAQTKAARDAGHELLLHVAMEPGSKNVDPGPNVLLTEHDEKELLRRLRWGLSRFDSYVGVNNHMGSKFTTNEPAMTVVLQELKRRGVLFLDSRTTGGSVGGKLAKRLGVPYAVRNIFLDNVNDEAAVYARLAEVERLARANGYAIAIGHPRDATINILPKWIKEIEALGFVLTPLSSVINDPDNS